jgi:hypothetical protein
MSFIASCPFCRRKVKAPEHALGRSISCKRCHNHFTLAPDDEAELHQVAAPSSSELEINFQAMPPTVTPSKRSGRGPRHPENVSPSGETVPQLKPLTTPALPVLPALGDVAPPLGPSSVGQPERLGWHTIGVVSMFLGSLALGCASLEWLQWLTIPLSALGLIAGAFGLMVDYTEKTEEWTPKVGAVVSGCVLLVALAWPAFFGLDPKLTSDLPPPVDPNRQVYLPRSAPAGAARPAAQPVPEGHWVAAELYDVDHGVVRLRIVSAGVHDVPATRKGRRGDKEYVVAVLLSHAGTKDAIPFSGWHSAAATNVLAPGAPGAAGHNNAANNNAGNQASSSGGAPRLFDASGKSLAFRPRLDAAVAPARSIVPFRPVQETLTFEAPAANSEYVRLELPASAFGASGVVRFQIPRFMAQGKQ